VAKKRRLRPTRSRGRSRRPAPAFEASTSSGQTLGVQKPPVPTRDLARWFSEAVHAEIDALEQDSREQRIELLNGELVSSDDSPYAIYQFEIADGSGAPEDARATIEIDGEYFIALVVALDNGGIHLQLEGAEKIGPYIARCILRIDDLHLLRSMAEALEKTVAGNDEGLPLSSAIYHPPEHGVQQVELPALPALSNVSDEQRSVLSQACGSLVTFVWGPPGTGKTHVIAHLLACLTARDERVLIASHTHAAVDQSLYEALKPAESAGGARHHVGPMTGSEIEQKEQIVRIGRVPEHSKLPKNVRLDDIVERKQGGLQREIKEVESRRAALVAERPKLAGDLSEWDRFAECQRAASAAEVRVKDTHQAVARAESRLVHTKQDVRAKVLLLEEAHRAWLFRTRKMTAAREALAQAETAEARARDDIERHTAVLQDAKTALETALEGATVQGQRCRILEGADLLRERIARIDADAQELESQLASLKSRLASIERQVVSDARIVACTLTKCYLGNELENQAFDALIVDEISMALPPLLFLAARRVSKRVILVGDFLQLPPIVRSDQAVSDQRLRQDVFHLSGIAKDSKRSAHRALVALKTQRRMAHPIADAARKLFYGKENLVDHPGIAGRSEPAWLKFMPDNALLIVDTADLHCWSGRQAGGLSRFNLYSAQISIELPAMAATAIPQPGSIAHRPIGIVTPYAAQRRLLLRLLQAAGLTQWATVGTVHTFQGGEAELIIFDTTLDDPYFTSRLCNPDSREDVRRDLNVALTRARSKFALVGSSVWLHRHARSGSGLGEFWQYFVASADLVSATELVEAGFAGRVADRRPGGYTVPLKDGESSHEILDERTFFPRFARDVQNATESVFGLVPYFGEYRWPTIEPLLRAALERGVEITLITPPAQEAENTSYVDMVCRQLRELGAVVVTSTGLHGKDVVIDGRIHYTGSLNWASHRGRAEIMHRTESREYAKLVLECLQARHVRTAIAGRRPRTCPKCGGPTHIVNQARPMAPWDHQPLKLGCANYQTTDCNYLVNIDERAPFAEAPRCPIDNRTRYRRKRHGRGEVWECPKHPRQCARFKVVQGDPDDTRRGSLFE